MSSSVVAIHRMTVAEFQEWDPPAALAEQRWELVDGEPVCMAPPSVDHGAIQNELGRLVGNWLAANRPDCRVITTPGIIPRVRSETNQRIPDLAVTCGPIRPARTLDDAVLLIEILSPSNEPKTRANVWAYTTIPTVREIVLLSGTSVSAEVLQRGPDGTWPSAPSVLSDGGELAFQSIGMTMLLRDAYRTSSLLSTDR